jgi:hypothetical protein
MTAGLARLGPRLAERVAIQFSYFMLTAASVGAPS